MPGRRTRSAPGESAAEPGDEGGFSCSVEWADRITARACLFVALDGEKVIGPRFVRLLREIGGEGSVRGAARRLGIGHRHAIAWIQRAELLLQRSLVARRAGGAGGGGATLTAAGESLVRAYLAIQADIAGRLESARADILGEPGTANIPARER